MKMITVFFEMGAWIGGACLICQCKRCVYFLFMLLKLN